MCISSYPSVPVLQVSSNEYSRGFLALKMTSTGRLSPGSTVPKPSPGCTSTNWKRYTQDTSAYQISVLLNEITHPCSVMQCHPLANIRSHQLHVLILQAIKNWGRGRPGNVQYFDSLIALIVSEGRGGYKSLDRFCLCKHFCSLSLQRVHLT